MVADLFFVAVFLYVWTGKSERSIRGYMFLFYAARVGGDLQQNRFFAVGLGVPACPQFGIVVQYAAAFCTLCLIATSPAFIPHCGRRLPSPAQNDGVNWAL